MALKFKIKIRKTERRAALQIVILSLLFLMVCGLGGVYGLYTAIKENLPSISALEEFEPNIITSIYSDKGEVIGEFAIEKRVEIPYEEIPEILKNAIIATEDPRFYNHHGIDYRGVLRAVKEDISLRLGGKPRKLQGGSTITQQLARLLFLHPRQTIRRKLKEALLALQIEKNYSKEKILTMYCNQFYLGHGVYGVEAASNLFFGKSVSELNLEECALITGIFRGPSVYSPYNRSELTLHRRNHVITRLIEEGYLSKEEGEELKEKPMKVLPLQRGKSEFAAFFLEEVRKYIEKNYGANALYREGLKVYTTLDPRLQQYAEQALRRGLRVMDKKEGWRADKRNLIQEGIEELEDVWLDSWIDPAVKAEDVVDAIVLSAERSQALVKVKDYVGRMGNTDIAWTKKKNLNSLIKKGDVIQVKIRKINEEKGELLVSLDQEPQVEGSFLAIDPLTGQIKAMVGGYSFQRSKWNRATQALRQPGSAIKPILYTAALENGFTPADIIVDEPTVFTDKWSEEPWEPPNYDDKYKGAVTVRKGLEESRNIVTAKLLEYISPQTGADYCRKFGITSPVYPYLSLSLGTFELSMLELVSAFTVFPNKGMRVNPYFIARVEDKEGNILEEAKIEVEEVVTPQIAYMMTYLLQGVIQHGTGWQARFLTKDKNLAGKTGTSDDWVDAWFLGFSPSLCAGAWVGHETSVSLGEKQSGAVVALPIWIEFFQRVIEDEKKKAEEEGKEFKVEEFEVPPNLSFVEIDRKTGLLATPFCLFPFKEVFLPGTEPTRFCSHEDHMMILDYYSVKSNDEH